MAMESTCELYASNGQLWSFGRNRDGQLADGTTTDSSTPAQVTSGISTVSSGGSSTEGSHTFYLKSDGTLWAVGYNIFGQLGNGTTTSRTTPVQVASGISAVSAGNNHSLYLKSDGTLWGMGDNQYGQLGDGTIVNRSTPVQVASEVSAIAAGGNHSLFLKSNGTLWATGYNSFGQLGDGNVFVNRSTPVQIATGVGAIAAGGSHSLFLKTDGTLWVTGWNANGQLGIGPGSSYLGTAIQLTTGVSAVAAGNQHSLFIKSDGVLWAMGQNLFGQLGDGTSPTNQKLPVQIATGVRTISAGASHSLFVKHEGTLWAMGLNTTGQLGDGTLINRSSPILVTDEVLRANGGAESSFFIKAPGLTTQLDSWTTVASGPANNFLNLLYADGRFVAGSAGLAPAGTGGVSLISTDGMTWSASTAGALANIDLTGLTYGNSLYVGVGAIEVGSGGSIITSGDGLSWSAGLAATQALKSVVFGGGQFVAVGDSGLIETSPDGSTWTTRSSGTSNNLKGVTYGSNLYVAVGSNGTVLTSADGVAWTARTAGVSGTSNQLMSVAYGNSQFVTVGNGIITSPDGLTWTQRMAATNDGTNYHSIIYRIGQYVAVGLNNSAQGTILNSSDAITWTTRNPGVSAILRSVNYGGNRFVVVGDNGTFLTSEPVGSAPVITTQPITQTVYAGNPVSFSVSALGAPPFTYQWKKNNVAISGATNATYTIAIADTTDTGSITALVTNSAGNVSSTAATLTVIKATQTITFAAIPTHYYGDAPFTLSATASPSGLPVTFSVVSGQVTLSGSTVTITGLGLVTIRASQAGNISYYAATNVDRSFTVAKGTPIISWATPASIAYGTALSATQLNATASTPGSFTYNPATGTTTLGVGNQTLSTTFTPTDAVNYFSTTGQQTIVITKATATVTLGSLSASYDGAAHAATATTSAGALTVNFTYNGSATAPTNIGSYTVVATIDDTNYQGTATGTLTISKADQTITFPALPTRTLGEAPFTLNASASPSSLPVTFSVVSGPATLALNTLTLTGAGTVTIRASQAGDANYNAAPTVDRSFTVSNPTPTITWTQPTAIAYGTALSSTQLNATANVPGTFSYNPASGTVLGAGDQIITATFTPTDTANYFSTSAQQTLTVNKAVATVTLGSLTANYDGSAHAVTATTTPAALAVTFTYNGAGSAPTNVANYTVVGTIADTNYQGTATGTLAIARGTPVITWSTPASIYSGTALSSLQLNATANTAGTFAYSPTSGTLLSVGTQTITTNFSPTDTANYNGATAQQSLVVLAATAPVITTQPIAQSISAGSAVTFAATASGAPTPTYQWKKGGVDLNGATSNTYTIASVATNDAASYTVVATNSAGSATSIPASLTVNVPSTGQPTDVIVTITISDPTPPVLPPTNVVVSIAVQ